MPRPTFPEGLDVGERLGKGSNNRVYAATWRGGHPCALRAPRRLSDTQQRRSAEWEFRHALRASQLGAGPTVYAAWCARHAADDEWTSGLYLVTERLDADLDTALNDDPALRARVQPHAEALGAALVRCLRALSDDLLYVYDLKPSNVMLRLPRGGGGAVDAKVIDFGCDFCEWAGGAAGGEAAAHDRRHPVIDMLRRRVRAREPSASADEVDGVVRHVLFACMLVQLAATTTRRLSDDREDHRLGRAERRRANFLAPLATQLLESMQRRNLSLVRAVLRVDEVRGVLRHYHGRRNAGTRRTLRLARGDEL